jgi:Predicted acetamidase/formamidase
VLEVRIRDIELRQDWGWNLQVPLRGTLPEDFPELRRLHVPLDRKNNWARMPWGQDLALEPFFGNFGVAPPLHWGRLSSKEPRVFGGNMDNKGWAPARPRTFRSSSTERCSRPATATPSRVTARSA